MEDTSSCDSSSVSTTPTTPTRPTTPKMTLSQLVVPPTPTSSDVVATAAVSPPIPIHSDTETILKHRLRLARAEIASLQSKLGIKVNLHPFGSSSPRGLSPTPDILPLVPSSRSPQPNNGDTQWGRSPSPLPSGPIAGSVSLGRALLEDLSPNEGSARAPSPTPTSTNGRARASIDSEGGARHAVENPFFGSGASRERMKNSVASASSGSGKVISSLQSDLLQARSALDSNRQQLRLSQRAVEHLSRQNEDLKDVKERLTTENDGLNKTIQRKDRLQDELLSRCKLAESSLAELQTTSRTATVSLKTRLKELEISSEEADGRRAKAESEYHSLRSGFRSMSEGWKIDLDWLRQEMVKKEAKQVHDLEEARLKFVSLNKLYKARAATYSDVTAILANLQQSQREFADTYRNSLTATLTQVDVSVSRSDRDLETVQSNGKELARLRRFIQTHEMEKRRSSVESSRGGGG